MAAKVKFVDDSKQLDALRKKLQSANQVVYVGILAEEGAKSHGVQGLGRKKAPEPATLIEVAVANEFGVKAKIPKRSFLRAWVDQQRQKIFERVVTEAKLELLASGLQGMSFDRALNRIGLWAQASIQRRIRDRIPPPNAPMTVANKGSDVPLIDTGQLVSSISYKLDKR